MISVETIAKIRRRHLGEGMPIRAVARELGVSRNTVRKVIRSGATRHRCTRSAAPRRPKLDEFILDLEDLLEANEKNQRGDRLSLTMIWSLLGDRGCQAGCDAVRRYARQWEASRRGGLAVAQVPQEFD